MTHTDHHRPSHRLGASALAVALACTLMDASVAQAQQTKPVIVSPTYIAPIPGQNLSPPAPRQNMVPTPPPPTRPGEGDSARRIQGGSSQRQPLPNNNN